MVAKHVITRSTWSRRVGVFFVTLANALSVVGALIPYMEKHYNASHTIMSLVFVGNAAGFILAAFFTNMLLDRLGRAKTLIAAELVQLSAYIVLVCTPPYALVVISYVSPPVVRCTSNSTQFLPVGLRCGYKSGAE